MNITGNELHLFISNTDLLEKITALDLSSKFGNKRKDNDLCTDGIEQFSNSLKYLPNLLWLNLEST